MEPFACRTVLQIAKPHEPIVAVRRRVEETQVMRGHSGSILIALATLAARTQAQCETWDPNFGANVGDVRALAAFDDGTGPALYAGGGFSSIGGDSADGLAQWNGTTWRSIYSNAGYQDYFQGLIVFDDGYGPALYAGGYFLHQGVQHPTIIEWNGGTSWTPLPFLGSLTGDSHVNALAVQYDGFSSLLFVAGKFSWAGSMPAQNIAVWDNGTWFALGAGLSDEVYALAMFDDGFGAELYAGGAFTMAGLAPAAHIARWDGTHWLPLSSGVDDIVRTLTSFDDASGHALFVGGDFTMADNVSTPHAARWDGVGWSALGPPGSGMNGKVNASIVFDAGHGPELYAGGEFSTAGDVHAARLARWNGVTWSGLPSESVGTVLALGAYNDGHDGDADLYVGGSALAEWHGCGTSAFCFGDGSVATCPCANTGQPGHGCDNSASTGGALLAALGTTTPDELTLTQSGEWPQSLSFFMQGSASLGAPVAFGDGLRCVGGTLLRLYARIASAGTVRAPHVGDLSITERSAQLGDPIAAGSARFYQVYDATRTSRSARAREAARSTWGTRCGSSGRADAAAELRFSCVTGRVHVD
jgi:hypothetical protein